MEEDLRNALRKLGIENIDKVIQFLQEQMNYHFPE